MEMGNRNEEIEMEKWKWDRKSLISGQKLTRTQTPNPGLHVALTHTSNWDKYTVGVASHFVSACWKTIQTCKYFATDIR